MDEAASKEGPSRRAVIAVPSAIAVSALLAGCDRAGRSAGSQPLPPASSTAPPAAAGPVAKPPAAAPARDGALAHVSDIPVGGGKIFPDRHVVITQPKPGTIKAFSATCTHQACTVARVDGTIQCPCHGSRFDIADGSVAGGPAPRGLPSVAVKVDDDAITLA